MRNQSESKKPNHRKLLEMACRHEGMHRACSGVLTSSSENTTKSPDSCEIAFEKVKKSVEKKGFN